MSIALALAAADEPCIVTVEDYPISFRLRRITSAHLIEAGGSTLLAVAMPAEEGPSERPTLSRAAALVTTKQAAAVAAVEAASKDGGASWEPFRLTLDVRRRAPERGILHLSDLPLHVQQAIEKAALSYATGGEEASERLARFLGGDAAGAGGAGAEGGEVAP